MAAPLHTLATKSLGQPGRPETLAYCPTMDLVALATEEEVLVFRLNGEKVFGVNCGGAGPDKGEGKREGGAVRVKWRCDGRMLAIASSDHLIRLVDVWTGKVVHRLSTGLNTTTTPGASESAAPSHAPISYLAYAVTSSSPPQHSQKHDGNFPESLEGLLGLDDLAAGDRSTKTGLKGRVRADLPRELAMLDIESSLPKLSTLPATGGDDDIFSTRASVDAVFHNYHHTHSTAGTTNSNAARSSSSSTIDVLLAGSDDGTLHLRIFDSFEIGNVSLTTALPSPTSKQDSSAPAIVRVLHHASHPSLSTHFLIVEAPTSGSSEKALHVLSLHLDFLSSSTSFSLTSTTSLPTPPPPTLPTLATKATQLANLLRYLTQIQGQLAKELQLAFELPGRFLSNIYATLADADSSFTPPDEEPEADEEKTERGKVLFESEVVKMVVTGICGPEMREWLVEEMGERGLKRWERGVAEGLEVVRRGVAECVLPALERALVILSRLLGLAGAAKMGVGKGNGLDETLLLRVQGAVDAAVIVGHDLLRVVAEEGRGFRAWNSWARWVAEVEGAESVERKEEIREAGAEGMEWLAVLGYVKGGLGSGRLSVLVGGIERNRGWDEENYYEEFKKARKTAEDVPGLGELVVRMTGLCQLVFEGIAASLRKSVRVGYVGSLSADCDGSIMDTRLLHHHADGKHGLELAIVSRNRSRGATAVYTSIEVQEGAGSATKIHRPTQSVFSAGGPMLDVKFVDDDSFLILVSSTSQPSSGPELLSHPTAAGAGFAATPLRSRHQFDQHRKPLKMQVNGRKGRSVVCVLEEGGARYEVLDLESGADGEDGDGEAESADDDMMD